MELQTRNKVYLVKELKHVATGCCMARPVFVGFVANNVALFFFFSEYSLFPLSVFVPQFSVIIHLSIAR